MRYEAIAASLILVFTILATVGCLDVITGDGSTTYESHPTKISFTISYGYNIICTGVGDYEIKYDCDMPEVINGQIISTVIQNDEYEDKTLATYNTVKSWDINSDASKSYNLGITASVVSESFLVSDLNGANALSMQEINDQHSNLIRQYCQVQSNGTIAYIDPNDPDIINIALNIYNNAGSVNSFIIAKELFKWLKQNTNYQTHANVNEVQPAGVTLNLKTGDCDDLSYLYMSLCRSVGIPARFIRGFLIEEDEATPHAWVEIFVGGGIGKNGWIPIECAGVSNNIDTEINQNFGVESAGHLRLFTDDGSNESLNISLAGLSYVTYGSRIVDPTYNSDVTDYLVLQSNELVIDKNNNRSYT